MNALIIVDVQNDFLPGGALSVPEGDQIIPIINELENQFPCVVATQDWHPTHHFSFASTHHLKPGEVIEFAGMRQELWPDHCVQGSWGAELAYQLKKEKIEKIFFKGVDPLIDSYSAFFDVVHLRSTGLDDYLKQRGVDEIYIVGLATDYCVKYSAINARELGLKVNVVIDACRGIELVLGDIERAVESMQKAGVKIVQSEKLLAQAFQN